MAHYLRLGLYAEGPTDYGLLSPLLRRLTEALCTEARAPIEIPDVEALDAPRAFQREDRATRILEAARAFWGGSCVLFIHADGGGDPARKEAEQVTPGAQLIRASLRRGACVAVIPVKEVDAWTLVDGEALRGALGTTLGDTELHVVSRPADVERITDPKVEWRSALGAALGPAGRRRARTGDYYARVGERVELAKLRQVPAFLRLEDELRAALREIGILPPI